MGKRGRRGKIQIKRERMGGKGIFLEERKKKGKKEKENPTTKIIYI